MCMSDNVYMWIAGSSLWFHPFLGRYFDERACIIDSSSILHLPESHMEACLLLHRFTLQHGNNITWNYSFTIFQDLTHEIHWKWQHHNCATCRARHPFSWSVLWHPPKSAMNFIICASEVRSFLSEYMSWNLCLVNFALILPRFSLCPHSPCLLMCHKTFWQCYFQKFILLGDEVPIPKRPLTVKKLPKIFGDPYSWHPIQQETKKWDIDGFIWP